MSGETEAQVSGWTTDTLKQHMDTRLNLLTSMLDERYATQSKAVDAAFVAQQVAMRTALESAEKAVNVALVSAEKAVTKAETAAEKRFESVNEFRSTLADQQGTFMTRNEYLPAHQNLAEKIDGLTDRLNLMTGGDTAVSVSKQTQRNYVGLWLSAAAVIVTILIAVVTIVLTR